MAMTLEELRRKAGTSQPAKTTAPTMTLAELRKRAGTTAPERPARVQPIISQPAQTAGVNAPAVSYADKVGTPVLTPTITAKEKYGNTLYVPASAISTENEKRNKLNYIVNENYRTTSGWGMNNPYSQLEHINEAERLAIADFVAKKDYDSAYKYLESISKDLDARLADDEYKQVKQFAQEHPVAAGFVSIGNSLFKPAELGVNYAEYAANELQGKDTQFDSNASTFSTSRFSEAANEGIMQDDGIVGQLVKGSALSMGNQLGVSALVGKGQPTEIFMAMQAAQDSLYENSKRGLTADESVLNSLGKGFITYATERFFPSEELLKIDKNGVVDTLWNAVKRGALPEGVEEVAENIVTNIWDTFQLGEKSEFNQLVEEYKARGYDKPFMKAVVQKYIYDSLMGFASGALSGAAMGGGVHMVNNALYGKNTVPNPEAQQVETTQTADNTQQATREQAQQTDDTASNRRFSVQEYADTLTETAKGNAVNYLNSEYKNTGITAAQYAENNLDGTFYKQNKLYYMEKDGKRVPVPKTIHDYATYLQNNVVKTQQNNTIVNSDEMTYNVTKEGDIDEKVQDSRRMRRSENNSGGEMEFVARRNGQNDIQSDSKGADSRRSRNIPLEDSRGDRIERRVAEKISGTTVAENGKPIKVYHYTQNMDFDQFGEGDVGFHFGNENQANQRKKDLKAEGGRTIKAYLNIQNPVKMGNDIGNTYADGMAIKLYSMDILTYDEYIDIATTARKTGERGYNSEASKKLRQILESRGYDGFEYNNLIEGDGKSYTALRPEQVIIVDDGRQVNKNVEGASQNAPISLSEIFAKENNVLNKKGTDTNDGTKTKVNEDLPESVGAMKSGYYAAIDKYGAYPEGENVTNPVDVPMSVDGEHGVTRGVRTIMEAEATKEDMLADFQKAIAEGDFNYEINRDKDAVDKAVNYIEKYGYKDAYEGWRKKVDNKQTITKDDMTQAQIMYASAVEYGDYDTAMKLATDISIQATKAGQVVQSMRILKKTTPDGRLYYAKKSLEAVQDEVNEKYGDNAPELKVDDKLWENLREAQTDEDIREATAKFNQAIAEQLPFDSQNFWIALRYLSMLGNTRTQIRNIASNFVTTGAQEYTNWVQSLIEKGLVKSGKNIEKTSTTKKPTNWQMEQAEADYVKVESSLYGEGKYKDSNLSTIQKMANPFDFKGKGGKAGEVAGKVLTKWNDATNWAMETGDKWFSAPAYKKYYARYLTANDITTEEQLTDKVRLRARAWATKQAKEAVYRESNAAADAIAKGEKWLRNQKSPVRKGAARVIGGIMPFRNTPLNITKRAFEYSPVGFAVELIKSKDEMDAGQLINSAAKSLSGTSLMILGYFLSQMGLITGGLGNDEDDKLKKEMGEQSYALTTPWFSYTLDWAGAGIMPLFMGAQIQKGNENNDGFFIALLDALSNASAPVMETSMMTGFMDAWQTASYEDTDAEKATAFIAGSLASYMNQYVPTLFGHIARAVDDTARSNYTVSSGIAQIFEKSVSKAKNKIPFLSKFNVPYMDVWGNEVENIGGNPIGRLAYNMLSPGYVEKKSADKVETMLQDVYDTTGENSVLPKNNTKSIDLGKGRKRMTAEQYEKHHKAYGKTAYNLLEKAVNNPQFMSVEDAYKVAVIDKIYDHASRMAARSLGKSQDNPVWERQDALNVGVNPYYLWAEGTSANMLGTKAEEYINKNCKDLSDIQKKYLYAALTTTKNNPYD